MRRAFPALAMVAVVALAVALPAQEPTSDLPGPSSKDDPAADARREAEALEFVRRHHGALADLLASLRTKDRVAYEAAIRELSRTRESLARVERRDPERAALVLRAWRAGSRVDLLTARLISRPDPGIESDLRLALAGQLAAQLSLQRYDRDQLRKRLEQMDETIGRLERRGDALVETRLRATLKKVQRVRRQAGDRDAASPVDAPARPSRPEGGES